MHVTFFPLFMKFGGPQKGGVLTLKTLPLDPPLSWKENQHIYFALSIFYSTFLPCSDLENAREFAREFALGTLQVDYFTDVVSTSFGEIA